MNNIIFPKYSIAPEKTEQKSSDPNIGEYFREVYDFVKLKKIKENKDRLQKYDEKSDKRKKQLRNLLDIGEKLLVLAERLKKKTPRENFIKAPQKINLFFTISNIVKLNNGTYLYWLKEGDGKVKGRNCLR